MSDKVFVTVGVDNRIIPAGGNKDQVLAKASNDDYDIIWADASGGGGGGGGVTPHPGIPPMDSASGSTGQANGYARGDHFHPINVASDVQLVKMDGSASLGTEGSYARVDHIHPHDDYKAGLVLYESANIYPNVASLPDPGTPGRIAFVKIT